MKRKKLLIIFISVVSGLFFLSTGYGLWQQTLVLKGELTVSKPQLNSPFTINIDQTVISSVYADVPQLEYELMEGESVTEAVYQENFSVISTQNQSLE